MFLKPFQLKADGFSLVECFIVLAIISVLALMAVPLLMRLVPYAQLRGAARNTAAVMQKARLQAANSQKLARVVVNCSDKTKPCAVRIDVPVLNGKDGTITKWKELPGSRQEMPPPVKVASYGARNPIHDDETPGLFWAVFLPSSQVLTSHKPFDLRFTTEKLNAAWQITLNQLSGRNIVTNKPNPK
jgi:prepilin-type N-terminal cleavage/methylation domain-containing protein